MFGVVNETIYYQFCPMARNGAGAYWLSAVKEIKNPYYGEAMLTCGENKEVIEWVVVSPRSLGIHTGDFISIIDNTGLWKSAAK